MKKTPLLCALAAIGGAGYWTLSPALVATTSPTATLSMTHSASTHSSLTAPSTPATAAAQTMPPPLAVTPPALSLNHDPRLATIPTPVAPEAYVSPALASPAPNLVGERTEGDGQPFMLRPQPGNDVRADDANVAKNVVLKSAARVLAVGAHDDLVLATSKIDALGNTYFKFQQTYQGLPVHGREVVVQTNADNYVASVSGEFESQIQLPDTQPSLTSDAAFQQAFSTLPTTLTTAPNYLEKPDLRVHVRDGKSALAWRSVVEYSTAGEGHRIDEIFVDANQGELLARYSRVHSALSRKLYTLNRACLNDWNMASSLPGTPIAATADGHARAAWDNTGYTYGFYDKMFRRDSFDGRGITLNSSTHALFSDPSGGCSGDNAVFLPDRNHMIFGEGGSLLQNPAGALDIVAHELTHGVTFHESNLVYENESGAINEALSDIFGAGAETYVSSGGTINSAPAGGLKPDSNNWLIGEKSALDPSYRRNMKDPVSDGISRDSYDTRYTSSGDNGGVHINSGIMNLAFYLLSEGGRHPRGRTTTTVEGISMKKALDVYYHANTNLFTQTTNFSAARMRLAQSAETLYGKCSKEWHSVHRSFDAVNVPGSWTACSGTGGGSDGGGSGGGDGGGTGGGTGGTTPIKAASAQTSSQYSTYYGNARLIDGVNSTPWLSGTIFNPGTQQWVMLDLGSSQLINQANILWNGNLYAGQYDLWVWSGSQWQLVRTLSQSAPGNAQISVNRNSQYVLLTMRNGSYGRWYGINEIALQ